MAQSGLFSTGSTTLRRLVAREGCAGGYRSRGMGHEGRLYLRVYLVDYINYMKVIDCVNYILKPALAGSIKLRLRGVTSRK